MIQLVNVSKAYDTPAGRFTALCGVSVEAGAGDFLAIVGTSGSGKSTLLNLVSGVDRATSGEVVVGGTSIGRSSERQLARWRGETVGIVFQFFQLLPTLTAIENVMLPMDFLGTRPTKQRRLHALALLDRVGLADQAEKLPATLSGGQQQRVAIARALANDPKVITADEPTGNLDSDTSAAVVTLFARLAAEGTTVLMATHEAAIATVATRTLTLRDGRFA